MTHQHGATSKRLTGSQAAAPKTPGGPTVDRVALFWRHFDLGDAALLLPSLVILATCTAVPTWWGVARVVGTSQFMLRREGWGSRADPGGRRGVLILQGRWRLQGAVRMGGEPSREGALPNWNGLLQRTASFSALEVLGAAHVSPHRGPYAGWAGGRCGMGRVTLCSPSPGVGCCQGPVGIRPVRRPGVPRSQRRVGAGLYGREGNLGPSWAQG